MEDNNQLRQQIASELKVLKDRITHINQLIAELNKLPSHHRLPEVLKTEQSSFNQPTTLKELQPKDNNPVHQSVSNDRINFDEEGKWLDDLIKSNNSNVKATGEQILLYDKYYTKYIQLIHGSDAEAQRKKLNEFPYSITCHDGHNTEKIKVGRFKDHCLSSSQHQNKSCLASSQYEITFSGENEVDKMKNFTQRQTDIDELIKNVQQRQAAEKLLEEQKTEFDKSKENYDAANAYYPTQMQIYQRRSKNPTDAKLSDVEQKDWDHKKEAFEKVEEEYKKVEQEYKQLKTTEGDALKRLEKFFIYK
jgi:hypothetical protein